MWRKAYIAAMAALISLLSGMAPVNDRAGIFYGRKDAWAEPAPRVPSGPRGGEALSTALRWIEGRVAPVQGGSPVDERYRGMVFSYDAPAGSPLRGQSTLYDNALGAIAFTMEGRFVQAESLLSAVLRNAPADGSFPFSFDLYSTAPVISAKDGAVLRSGALAWFGYALVYYLEVCPSAGREGIAEPVRAKFLEGAEKIARTLLAFQVIDSGDLRYGLIIGGRNTLVLRYDAEKKSTREVFVAGAVPWASAEHNIDAYFFLGGLARLTGDERYRRSALLVRRGMLERLWDPRAGQFSQGMDSRRVDTALSLDCASWGSLFALAAGEKQKALRSVEAMRRFRVTEGDLRGYGPYAGGTVYESRDVGVAVFGDHRRWDDLPMVWPEGSLGAAAALARVGRAEESLRVIEEIIALRGLDGGIPYATRDIPYLFTKHNSTASSAWMIIALNIYNGTEAGKKFWR